MMRLGSTLAVAVAALASGATAAAERWVPFGNPYVWMDEASVWRTPENDAVTYRLATCQTRDTPPPGGSCYVEQVDIECRTRKFYVVRDRVAQPLSILDRTDASFRHFCPGF